jgi:hypothetical protein
MNVAFRRVCVAIAAVLVSGCATPVPTAQMTLPFNPGDVAWSRASGTATVEGRAAMSAAGNMLRTCAGGEAQLVPAGTYSAEMMRIVFGNDLRGSVAFGSARYPTNVAPGFGSTVRRIGCDPEGRFRFDAVPAGRWYVFSNVVFRGTGADAPTQGAALMQRIDVAEGARASVMLVP